MTRPTISALTVVVAAVALAAGRPIGAAAAPTVLSHEPAASKVSAAGGAVAWSTLDAASGSWWLVVRRAGVTERAPVAPRPMPFDVDLGRDAAGRLVAAYSRCAKESRGFLTDNRGCDVYVYDLDRRRERLLREASTPGASEFLPTLAAGRVAFARIDPRLPGARGRHSRLYVRSLSAGATARRLPGGSMNDDDRTGPTALDLDDRRLAFGWDAHGPTVPSADYGTSELIVDGLGGGRTIVARAVQGDLSGIHFLTPTLLGGRLYYGRTASGDGDGPELHRLERYDPATGARGSAPAGRRLEGTATDDGVGVFVRCDPGTSAGPALGCDVLADDAIAYADPDPELARATRPTTASAYKGSIAFSAYDDGVGGYRLMLRRPDGRVAPLAVAPRTVPFDVDLGPGPDGGLTAVYSRCATEPRADPADGLPLPWTGRGCSVYRHAVAGGRETRVAAASAGGASAYLPSIWGDELAFARVARTAPARTPGMAIVSLRTGRARRVPAGPAGVAGRTGPRAADLFGRRLAFAWDARTRAGAVVSELRLDTTGAAPRRVARVASADGRARLLAPSFEQGLLSWVRRGASAPWPPTTVERLGLAKGTRVIGVLPEGATTYIDSRMPVATTRVTAYAGVADGAWTLRSLASNARYVP